MKEISGGVTAALGFTAGGVHCGVKKGGDPAKLDLALIVAECDCAAAAVYTSNRVKSSPIYATMQNLENGRARAIICNSGCANTCAPEGLDNARRMSAAAAKAVGCGADEMIVASTGVIGQRLNIEAIETGLPGLAKSLSIEGSEAAARAIMTTDTVPKQAAIQVIIGGKTVKIGGIAKGSGMIHPNMGTLLAFITTDCHITSEMLHDALTESVKKTFNRISIDGDTSTNDMACVLASGLAGNELIEWKDGDYHIFLQALTQVCRTLARDMARDGEGASRLITCRMLHSRSEEAAERLAKSVISSSLVKTALFGADANWGRVLCAMGYAKAPFRPEHVDASFHSDAGTVMVCREGAGLDFDEELAKQVLTQDEVIIEVDLKEGDFSAECWGCDLTYDYVKINGDYRT